ncbi:MAG: CBS domain-containing protein [Rhizobiales bacterium]|jgi:CBS domain-containing protein|nr:CBS domain-containing protein [Hyphomicrobiales bacterium]
MTVRKILSLKGSDVLTIAPEKKLLDAIALLAKHKIGALVVTGSNREVVGIISERDIVRLLSNTDNNRFENTVASAMTKEVKTCKPEDTIQRVMQVMTAGRFRHMPVVENGRLTGVISIGDVVKLRLEEMERESEHLKEYIATA